MLPDPDVSENQMNSDMQVKNFLTREMSWNTGGEKNRSGDNDLRSKSSFGSPQALSCDGTGETLWPPV
jgi:hypothetical protein